MRIIKKIDALSFALVVAFIEGIIGFILGFLIYIIMAISPKNLQSVPDASLKFGAAIIVIYPVLYYIVGFIGGLVVAYLYNIYAAKWQGIKIELK